MENQKDPLTRLLREAAHYMDINRFEEARRRYTEILSQEPTKGFVHYRLGHCCYRMGNYDEAIEHCQDALANGYSSPMCYVIIGLSQRTQKRFDVAETTFNEGLELFPTNANLMAQTAFLYWQRKKRKQAQQLIHEARAIAPDDQVVLYYSYFIVPHQRRSTETPEILQRYMESDATEVQKKLLVVNELLRAHKYREARDVCREAFVLDPLNQTVIKKLEMVERFCHPSFFPNRIIGRIGKWKFIIFLYIITISSMLYLELFSISLPLLVLYAWARCAPWIYKGIMQLQRWRM